MSLNNQINKSDLENESVKDNKEVVFSAEINSDHTKRKRYLTAKYDKRTRQKISEKIRLENFVFEQLRKLYNTDVDDYECDIDLDEISALSSNEARIHELRVRLTTCPAKKEDTEEFIQNLLKRMKFLPQS